MLPTLQISREIEGKVASEQQEFPVFAVQKRGGLDLTLTDSPMSKGVSSGVISRLSR